MSRGTSRPSFALAQRAVSNETAYVLTDGRYRLLGDLFGPEGESEDATYMWGLPGRSLAPPWPLAVELCSRMLHVDDAGEVATLITVLSPDLVAWPPRVLVLEPEAAARARMSGQPVRMRVAKRVPSWWAGELHSPRVPDGRRMAVTGELPGELLYAPRENDVSRTLEAVRRASFWKTASWSNEELAHAGREFLARTGWGQQTRVRIVEAREGTANAALDIAISSRYENWRALLHSRQRGTHGISLPRWHNVPSRCGDLAEELSYPAITRAWLKDVDLGEAQGSFLAHTAALAAGRYASWVAMHGDRPDNPFLPELDLARRGVAIHGVTSHGMLVLRRTSPHERPVVPAFGDEIPF